MERGYTILGQLNHLTLRGANSTASEQQYQYDALGRMSFCSLQGDSASKVIAYNYDAAGRLIGSQHGDNAHRYSVDAAGNRLEGQQALSANRLTQLNGTRYRYDGAGNLIHREHQSGERITLGYDGANRLVTLTRTTANGQTTHANYRYDALGRRIDKTVHHPNGTTATTHYGWDGDRIVREDTEQQRTTVIYEPGSFVPMLRIDQGQESDEQHLSTYITDALGTPLQLLTPNGKPRWLAEPDDWAAVTNQRAVPNVTQPIRFQGQWHDEESGLYYNRHRYYDPEQGGYISQDPIGLNGGDNLYQYAASPIMEVDPLGLSGVYGLSGSRYSQPNMVRQAGNELEASLSGGLTGQAFGGIAGVSASRNKIIAPNGTFNSNTVCWQLGAGVYAGGGGAGALNLSSDPVSPGVSDSFGAFFSGGAGPLGGGGNLDLTSSSLSTAKAFLGPGIGAAGGLQFCRTWVHERGNE